jgi:hypothetical protein
MIDVREATPADREAILALRVRCFPRDDREKQDPRFWDWEFRDGRMFIAEEHGRAVAHLGFVSQPLIVHGARVTNLLAVDAMTDPDYRGRRLFARVAVCARDTLGRDVACSTAWQIRTAVLGGMTAAGWRIGGGARVLIRPLTIAFGGDGGATRDVERMAAIAREFFSSSAAYTERTAQWLSWRCFANPLLQYEVTATDDAWLVTRRTRLKGVDTLAIVDVAWRNGRSRDARLLLARALRTSRATLAATLVTRAHPAFAWFLRRGFLPGPHRFNLLVNEFSTGRRVGETILSGAPGGGPDRRGDRKDRRSCTPFTFVWGDTDHL